MRETGHHQMINTLGPLTVTERKSPAEFIRLSLKWKEESTAWIIWNQRAFSHPPSFDSSSSIMIQPVGGIAPDSSGRNVL